MLSSLKYKTKRFWASMDSQQQDKANPTNMDNINNTSDSEENSSQAPEFENILEKSSLTDLLEKDPIFNALMCCSA